MQEIFLGVRRPPRSGRLGRRLLAVAAVGLLLFLLGSFIFRRLTGASPPEGQLPEGGLTTAGSQLGYGRSTLERAGDLWILRQQGDAFALGAEAGRLLGAPAGDAEAALDVALLGDEDDGGWLSRSLGAAARRWRLRHVADGLAPAWRQELAGLALGWEAAGLPRAPGFLRLCWRQAALDLGHAPGLVGGPATGLAFVAGARGGRVVMGRAFGLSALPRPSPIVVALVRGEGKVPFARVGWPGEIGVVTGVSAEGLAIAVDPVVADDIDPAAEAAPLALVARDVLERAHGLEEALNLLQAARPLGAGALLLVDGKTGRWAVVERTPGRQALLRPDRAMIADSLEAPEHARDAENDRARRGRAGAARALRLAELLEGGVAPEPGAVAAALRDRRGKGDAVLPLGSGAAIDDLAQAHVAVIDVTALALWVGEGPGAAGPLRALDLRHELLGDAPRPLAAVPADAGLDPEAARAVVLARHELDLGLAAARHGRWRQAAEAAARAQALAPGLPAAHKLAADAARALGDRRAAAAHYRRYLELGADDPTGEREARAYLGT